MVSAIISHDTGFWLQLDSMKLAKIISVSRRGKKYVDEAAAINVLNNVEKQDMKESLFVKYFELGADSEGYRGYNNMVLQLKDCVDCLKAVYPHLESAFLFAHSSRHSKKRQGGLDASHTNYWFGGSQPTMRNSKIVDRDGFLGPYNFILGVGMKQSMRFSPTDIAPFWMTATEQNRRRLDRARTEADPPKAQTRRRGNWLPN
jgi:hypothetical protein